MGAVYCKPGPAHTQPQQATCWRAGLTIDRLLTAREPLFSAPPAAEITDRISRTCRVVNEAGLTRFNSKNHPNHSAAALGVGLKGYPESHRELNENLQYIGSRPLLEKIESDFERFKKKNLRMRA